MNTPENSAIFALSPVEQMLKYIHINNFSLKELEESGALEKVAKRFGLDIDFCLNDIPLGSYLNPPKSLEPPDGKSLFLTRGLRYKPPHTCNMSSVEFMYVYSGQCRLAIKRKEYIFQKGDLCIFPPFRRNSYILDDDRNVIFNLCMWPETFKSIFLNMSNNSNKLTTYLSYIFFYDDKFINNPSFLTIRTGKDETFDALFHQMWEEEVINDEHTDLMQISLFNQICVEILRKYPNSILLPANLSTVSTIDAILVYIEQNAPMTSLKETAEHFCYSTSHLCRLIKSSTGKTFNALLHGARLKRAAELLRFSDLTIEIISSSVGYVSLNSFYRLFNKEYGMTPAEYRKLSTSKN